MRRMSKQKPSYKDLARTLQTIGETSRPEADQVTAGKESGGSSLNKGIMLALLTTVFVLFAACSQPVGVNQ